MLADDDDDDDDDDVVGAFVSKFYGNGVISCQNVETVRYSWSR